MKISARIKKTNGSLELLRFRIRDGRNIELWFSTGERIDVNELKRCYVCSDDANYITSSLVEVNGLRRVNEDLKNKLDRYKDVIEKVYDEIKGNVSLLNSKSLTERVKNELEGNRIENSDILEECYESYINKMHDKGLVSDGRYAHYMVSLRELRRFLAVNKCLSMTVKEFTGDELLDLAYFLENEYKYIDNNRHLYIGMDARQLPDAPRSRNTIASKMKFYRTFFTYLYESGQIERSPFTAIGKNNRKTIMKESYDAPVYLTTDELNQIRNADIPESMNEVRDAFVLHCEIGARVEDFRRLSMKNIRVHDDGFVYVLYQPSKTANESGMIVETPLMCSGLDIVKKYGFSFKILRNLWGVRGYNRMIKELVRLAGIEREVTTKVGGVNTRKVYELASTKMARKTFVTAMQQVQIDDFAAGLHSEGSEAVHRYGDASSILCNRYKLMCCAFGEKPYKIKDSHLNY